VRNASVNRMSAASLGSSDRPLRVAVVGAGPAGFYAADALTKHDAPVVSVDLFDRLPAPYGLVRYGVAPDHQKIKSVIKAYEKIAMHPRVRFLGNVRVCEGDLTVDDLLEHYDQIVFTVGCETDRRLGVAGEDMIGSHAATSFVAWYNGHPSFVDYSVDLSAERAAVIGVGDVAMDLTRMLIQGTDELQKTDVADEALDVFRTNRVREVLVIARRGPAEVSFATKELEDIAALPGVDVRIDPADVAIAEAHARDLDGLARRKLAYLASLAAERPTGNDKVVRFLFFRSPTRILGEDRVTGLELEINRLEPGPDGRMQARGTGEHEQHALGLVFRSVGYRGVPLEGVPFDDRAGTIPNDQGRVLRDGNPWARVYCAGWIKRGATGVIGTNKSDAAETVARMFEDLPTVWSGETNERRDPRAIDALLAAKGVRVVTFPEWKRLDSHEVREGERTGRIRRKLTRVEDMLDILDR
jgi:ferredoxin--NADP+ reductase